VRFCRCPNDLSENMDHPISLLRRICYGVGKVDYVALLRPRCQNLNVHGWFLSL
jgi:hypothetical protein